MSKRREPKTCRITVIMSEDLKARVEQEALDIQRSLSDFVRIVLIEWCEAVDAQRAREAEEAED